ncbi:MAG: 30S ribosome-binding factor RbfA [Clostridia bacterium]|nr:30S ribosome-binding factor RbfA [Clostridia bacterium]
MAGNRIERVNAQIQRILANTIANDINDPRLKGFVSVTNVDTSNDLSHCKVYLSIFGTDEKTKQESFYILKNSVPFLRKTLARSLDIRITPELHLFLDNGMQESEKMEKLIQSLNINKE